MNDRPSRQRGERVFDTGLIDLVADNPSSDVVNPLMAPVRAIELKDALFDIWLMGRTKLQARLGVEFSNHPLDFYTPSLVSRKELTAAYQTGTNWTYGSTWHDLFNVTGLVDADYKLYLRLVALATTTSASTKAEGAQMRVRMRTKPIAPRTHSSPWVRIATKGSTGTNNNTPVTDALPTENVAIHRVTVEMMANSGVSMTVGWQETNTPDDLASWTSGGTLGSAVSTNGIVFPGKPVAVAPSKRFMRYVGQSVNISGTDIEAALVRFVIDQRDR